MAFIHSFEFIASYHGLLEHYITVFWRTVFVHWSFWSFIAFVSRLIGALVAFTRLVFNICLSHLSKYQAYYRASDRKRQRARTAFVQTPSP